MLAWVHSETSGFLPPSKNTHVRHTGNSNLRTERHFFLVIKRITRSFVTLLVLRVTQFPSNDIQPRQSLSSTDTSSTILPNQWLWLIWMLNRHGQIQVSQLPVENAFRALSLLQDAILFHPKSIYLVYFLWVCKCHLTIAEEDWIPFPSDRSLLGTS